MFSLKEEFDITKNMSKEIESVEEDLKGLKEHRLNYFKDIVRMLNNHRDELKEMKGLQSYNYCDCPDEYYGTFNLHSYSKLTAKGLCTIEEITGCEFKQMYDTNNETIYIFELEKIQHRGY